MVDEQIAHIRRMVARPRECHCTGACDGDPQNKCPAFVGQTPTYGFEELITSAANMAEICGSPERARAFREALEAFKAGQAPE